MPDRSRGLLTFAFGLWLAAPVGARPVVEVMSSSAARLTVAVTPSGADIAAAIAGESLETGFLVVVPPGAFPELEVVSVASRSSTATGATALPATAARLAESARAGGYDLRRIAIAPVIAGGAGAAIVSRLVLSIHFVGGSSAKAPGERTRAGGDLRLRGGAGAGRVGPVTSAVAEVAVNGALVREWSPSAAPASATGAARSVGLPLGCLDCIKIEVVEDGMHRLEYDDLATLPGFVVGSQDPRRWHMYHAGLEIPIEIVGEADGSFDRGDEIVFLGQRNRGPYTDSNFYWLIPEGALGRRLARRPAVRPEDVSLPAVAVVTGTVRLEEQNVYYRNMPVAASAGEAWTSEFLRSLEGVGAAELTLPSDGPGFAVPDLAPGGNHLFRARVLSVIGQSAAEEQELRFEVNGSLALVAAWNGRVEVDKTIVGVYDSALLTVADNRVRVVQPELSEWRLSYLDWIELDYPRRLIASGGAIEFAAAGGAGGLYHVGGFAGGGVRVYAFAGELGVRLESPRYLSLGPGMPLTTVFAVTPLEETPPRVYAVEPDAYRAPARVLLDAPSELRSTDGTPYVAIAYEGLAAAAAPLAALRGGRVVSLTDIYDEFNHGNEDPAAIREFIAHAYHRWLPRPEFVVLVGDASQDPRNRAGLTLAEYDPPSPLPMHVAQLESEPWLRVASDTWFAAVDGDDIVPDVALSRLPARTPAEVTQFIAKLEDYALGPGGDWQKRIELFADDDPGCAGVGVFGDELERVTISHIDPLASGLVRRYAGSSAYRDIGAPVKLRNDILADINDLGIALQVYSGHGNALSMARHCFSPNFGILTPDQVDDMTNGPRYPVAVAMTCSAANFSFSYDTGGEEVIKSIAEHFLLADGRGHIGFIGTTAVLLEVTGIELTEALFSVLYGGATPNDRVLGGLGLGISLAHFADKGVVAADGIDTLAVLGDAAMPIRATDP